MLCAPGLRRSSRLKKTSSNFANDAAPDIAFSFSFRVEAFLLSFDILLGDSADVSVTTALDD